MSTSLPDEKPLSVRCAEALGWIQLHIRGFKSLWCCGDITLPCERWAGRRPGNVLLSHEGFHDSVPPYGEDSPEGWACTGPLVERFGLDLSREFPGTKAAYVAAICDPDRPLTTAAGPTACSAIAEWVASNVENGEVKK